LAPKVADLMSSITSTCVFRGQAIVRPAGLEHEGKNMSVVMLISDDEITTRQVRSTLEGMSFEVVVAATESDVTRLCVAFRPSIVISDIEMQGGMGFESIATVRRLRKDAYIIAVSRNYHQDWWLKVARACGADDYIPGPLAVPGLIDAIGGCPLWIIRADSTQSEPNQQRMAQGKPQ
jgi:DNA-binding response OmpR family regulator